MLKYLCNVAGVQPGPQTPEGVYARVVEGRTLFVNTTSVEKKIPISGSEKGILTGRVYDGAVVLKAQEADLVQ
ncbi:MAG: hypothetical protein JF563_04935 [Acidobacteriales bacterium]|nr:hypothetical protein [Terriglobales bacterium]